MHHLTLIQARLESLQDPHQYFPPTPHPNYLSESPSYSLLLIQFCSLLFLKHARHSPCLSQISA